MWYAKMEEAGGKCRLSWLDNFHRNHFSAACASLIALVVFYRRTHLLFAIHRCTGLRRIAKKHLFGHRTPTAFNANHSVGRGFVTLFNNASNKPTERQMETPQRYRIHAARLAIRFFPSWHHTKKKINVTKPKQGRYVAEWLPKKMPFILRTEHVGECDDVKLDPAIGK